MIPWGAIVFFTIAAILLILVIARTIYRCFTNHGCCKTEENLASQTKAMSTSRKSDFFEMEVEEPPMLDSTLEPEPDPDPLAAEILALQREKEKLNELLFDPKMQHAVDVYDPHGYYSQFSVVGEDSNAGYDEPDRKVRKPKTESSLTANNGINPPPESNQTNHQLPTLQEESKTYQELDLKDVSPHTEDFTALVFSDNPELQNGTENPSFEVHVDSSDSEHSYEITIATV
ncbi:uncharacterized protein [Asterias amurensis]|uniref:uncharacterized protein n=1 Tax=Asterias amurensis TaxID=7602 RepID=UPI003AB64FC8